MYQSISFISVFNCCFWIKRELFCFCCSVTIPVWTHGQLICCISRALSSGGKVYYRLSPLKDEDVLTFPIDTLQFVTCHVVGLWELQVILFSLYFYYYYFFLFITWLRAATRESIKALTEVCWSWGLKNNLIEEFCCTIRFKSHLLERIYSVQLNGDIFSKNMASKEFIDLKCCYSLFYL